MTTTEHDLLYRALEQVHEVKQPRRIALLRGRSGLTIGAIALWAFTLLFGIVRSNQTAAFDMAVSMRMQRRRHPWIGSLMSAISWPGFPPQSRILVAGVVGTIWALGFRTEALFQGAAWLTAPAGKFLKWITGRPRPAEPIRVVIAPLGGSSFPSGHVLEYTGAYGFLSYLTYTAVRPAGIRRALLVILLPLVALVGPSRIYLGHHWATDVVASYCLGLSYVIGLGAIYRRAKERFERD